MALLKGVAVVAKCLIVPILLMITFEVLASEGRITGTYSSLKYNEQSGDLLGYEVLIIPTDVGFKGVVQVAEGAPGQVYIVEVTKKGENVSFDIPLGSAAKGSFSGYIAGNFLVGDILSPSGKEHVRLKRGMSYWDVATRPKLTK